MIEHPNYYAIIPATVRYSDISSSAKLLYAEISALCNKEGYCWATNNYFAELYGISVRSMTRLLSILEKKDFVKIVIDKNDGYKRKIFLQVDVKLSKMMMTLDKNVMGVDKNVQPPLDKNVQPYIYNNTSINILDTGVSNRRKAPDGVIDFILSEFKKRYGFSPIDGKPRQVAYNIKQITNTFIKHYGEKYEATKKEKPDTKIIISRVFDKFMEQDYAKNTQKLETFKRHLKKILEITSDKYDKQK